MSLTLPPANKYAVITKGLRGAVLVATETRARELVAGDERRSFREMTREEQLASRSAMLKAFHDKGLLGEDAEEIIRRELAPLID